LIQFRQPLAVLDLPPHPPADDDSEFGNVPWARAWSVVPTRPAPRLPWSP